MDGLGSLDSFVFEGLRFDRASGGLVRTNGSGVAAPVVLGSRALAVLALLVERQGQLVSKDEIFATIWPGIVVGEGNLTVQISALRRVLDHGRIQGSCIQTVPGRGYRFVVPATQAQAAIAASFATDGNESAAPTATGGHTISPSVVSSIDDLTSTPARGSRPWPRRPLLATMVVAALCLLAVTIATVNWRSLTPREVRFAPRPSIIVLPFASLSRQPDEQRLSDAVTADITTDLSRIWDLVVISQTIASNYRRKAADAKQIGRELGVRYVLEGSVQQRPGNGVGVNFELVDAESGAQLRADRFDTDTTKVTDMQKEITDRIARTITIALPEVERSRIEQERRGDPDWHDLIMLGWAGLNAGDGKPAEIQQLFERALESNPQSLGARLGLARLFIGKLVYPQTSESRRIEARTEQLLSEALKIDPNRAQTHAITGVLRRLQNRLTESRTELETAIALEQSDSYSYYELGVTLMYLGRPEVGIPYIERAMRLNPSNPAIARYYWGLGACHLLLGHVDEAVDLLQRARASNPRHVFVHEWLAAALGLKGDLDEARTELAEMSRMKPELTSLEAIRIHAPFTTNPEHSALRERTIDLGLRRAGLPDE